MEILVLIMLYYLSQNPDFERSVKPILGELNNSQELLKFLKDLSRFSALFSGAETKKDGGRDGTNIQSPPSPPPNEKAVNTENHASATNGFSNPFIEELLEKYFTQKK